MSDKIQKQDDGYHRNGHGAEYLPTFSVPRSNENETDSLDPKKIFSLLLRHKLLILFFLIIGGIGGWFYANSITPRYESSGTLMISSNSSTEDELSRIISQTTGMGTGSTIANELQVIQSREFSRLIAERMIEENPGDRSEFPILFTEDEEGNISRVSESSVTGRIRRNLSTMRPESDSDVIQISFRSTSPEETAYVVNAAMDIYVDRSTQLNRQAAELTSKFLESEREEIQEKLRESEQRLQDFMDSTGIVQVDEQASGMVSRQVEIESELQAVNLELQTIEQAIANHEQQLDRIKPGLSEQFSEAIGPRIRNSQEELARYESERTLILSKNPGVREREVTPPRLKYLDEQIARVKEEITELSEQLFTEDDEFMGMDTADRAELVSNIQSRLVELQIEQNQYQSRKNALEERKTEANANFESLPEGMIELARLQRDVAINEELFLSVSSKYAEMSVLKQSQFGFGRIIDSALVPSIPVSPNKNLLLIVGIIFGGFFAGAIIAGKEFFDNSINSVDQLKFSQLPMLAAIPELDKVPNRKKKSFKNGEEKIPDELVLLRDRSNIASESVRRLKNNIVYQHGDTPPKTIAVTSAEKGDGKSTIVSNLGIAFAEEGYKTLVIDTDFRRPRLHQYFGLSNKNGLTDYLAGNLPIIQLFRNTDLSNLKVVTAGSDALQPENIVNSKEFKKFLTNMEEMFEVIILDTPPFGIISDSTSLLKKAEATLLVTKYRKTNRGVFLKTIEELNRINANVIGIALNAFDHRKETGNYYGAGYYKSFYSNYEAYVS
jgi:capsular exopolysaccharide synthesis family protein